MYEFDWVNRDLWTRESSIEPAESRLSHQRVAETLLVHWQEHCVECAPPHCYTVCPLYVARGDQRCARFVYGVYRNPAFRGLLDSGADVRFRRWGKIETRLYGHAVSVGRHRLLDKVDALGTALVSSASRSAQAITKRRRLNASWAKHRESMLAHGETSRMTYDDFVLECFVGGEQPVRLILERVNGDSVTFRHAFELTPGHNFHTVPAEGFGQLDGGRVRLYPDADAEPRIVFTWLDFVRYAENGEHGRPASKIKVLAWDLDNTLWDGTILEDGEQSCRLRDGVLELVRALDARGILQTIVSKNDHDHAWAHLGSLGIQEYFLYPSINWGQKSENLRQCAEKLNVGLDTFAVIDDSPFERAEVAAALPMVRVYSELQIDSLLSLSELDVPVTEMSAKRRLSYMSEADRGRALERFGGDYHAFLRKCDLRVRVFVPKTETEIRRCSELIQRSNQLNLSARRYSAAEFMELLATPGVLCVALAGEDRFGDYGIVGFSCIDERDDVPTVRDFVLSCRIAGKLVEPTFLQWLAVYERERGASRIRALLKPTKRNAPIVRVLDELPFELVGESEGGRVLEMPIEDVDVADVISLVAEL